MTRTRFSEILGRWSEGDGPLYQRLAEAIGAAIERGDLPGGTRLPAQRVLAKMLRVSRTTVVLAYGALLEDERLESREGSGTRVRAAKVRPLGPRGGAAAVLGSRNVVFRGLVEKTGAEIEFLGAHFDGLPEIFTPVWSEAGADLAKLIRGHGYMPLGLPALREAAAAHLTRSGLPTTPDQVLITTGAQQAISLVANLFIEPGDSVVLEDPTYLGAIDAFTSFGARLTGVPVGPDGVRVEPLRDAVTRGTPRAVYLVPTCHNPTGAVLSEPARREVARMIEKSSAVWVEDLALADITLADDAPPPLAALAPGGTVLSVGSLSKLFWGGLRVGWIRGPEALISRMARIKVVSDLSGSLISQAVAARVLDRAHELVALRRRQTRERLAHAERLLARHLPDWSYRRPAGGLSIWVRIPIGSVAEFAAVARRRGVAVVPGTANSPEGRFHDHLRLPFVGAPEVVEEGIRRLGEAWQEYAPDERDQRRAVGVLV